MLMTKTGFVSDIEAIRNQARKNIEDGAVTQGYKADKVAVIKVLNDALATELVCVLRYKYHHLMAKGINSEPVAAEFLEHANEDLIAERIAIDTYRDIIKFLGEDDSTSRRLMEEILEKEEEHADDMANLLGQLSKSDNGGKTAK